MIFRRLSDRLLHFPLGTRIVCCLLAFLVATSIIHAILLVMLYDDTPATQHASLSSVILLWMAMLLVNLLLLIIFAWLFIEWVFPVTRGVANALNNEIAIHRRIFRKVQGKWNNLANDSQEKKHNFTAHLNETTNLNQRLHKDLQEILQQLKKISSSLENQSNNGKRMAKTLSEMSTAVQSVVSHSEAAVTTSRASEGDAKRGGEVVNKIIKHMNKITRTVSKSVSVIRELRKRSDEIVEIINVIDDIAEQTNLLALNAAIEAARAGAQGRGFAVVADQVRSLAEKTTHATKEIAGTLSAIKEETSRSVAAMDESVREIDIGAGFAVQAGVSLRKIVAGAQKVTQMISIIASAAEKQSQAATAITNLVEEVSREADSTSAESQSAVLSSQDLEKRMQKLSQLMEHFLQTCLNFHTEEKIISLGITANDEILLRSHRLQEIHDNIVQI